MVERIRAYFLALGMSEREADELHMHYYKEYGLAIRGLVRHHTIDPMDYDEKCDASLPLDSLLRPDDEVIGMLTRLDRTRTRVYALTNAYKFVRPASHTARAARPAPAPPRRADRGHRVLRLHEPGLVRVPAHTACASPTPSFTSLPRQLSRHPRACATTLSTTAARILTRRGASAGRTAVRRPC